MESIPRIFIFNGDADGITGQHILEMHEGGPSLRITGRKRDIQLLRKLPPLQAADLRVFDISLHVNREALDALLALEGVRVTWYDHHYAGDPPAHARLTLHITQSKRACTAVVVNAACGGGYPHWAALAAYGDNMPVTAEGLLRESGLARGEWEGLAEAGRLLNYNAYGERPGDLLFEPAALAEYMAAFASALDFSRERTLFGPLAEQCRADRAGFRDLEPVLRTPGAEAFLLPDAVWARRYAATWANEMALEKPGRALATVQLGEDGTYRVSLRAPAHAAAPSAAELAKEFPTGGGRRGAAGINNLPAGDLDRFLGRFREIYGGEPPA